MPPFVLSASKSLLLGRRPWPPWYHVFRSRYKKGGGGVGKLCLCSSSIYHILPFIYHYSLFFLLCHALATSYKLDSSKNSGWVGGGRDIGRYCPNPLTIFFFVNLNYWSITRTCKCTFVYIGFTYMYIYIDN